MVFTIIRVAHTEYGTFGVMKDNVGIPFCLTLERPWLNNEKHKSCIPVGTYICKRKISPKFGETFEVCNVPNRSDILFHKGNIMDDTHGCVVLGEMFESLHGRPAVLSSGKAMQEFLLKTRCFDQFTLVIEEVI